MYEPLADECHHGVSMFEPCLKCVDEHEAKEMKPNYMYGEFKLSGGSNDYYDLDFNGTIVRCKDIISKLQMNYAEGNAFKAVWRHALARQGKGKPGSTCRYEAEKIEYFGADLVEQAKEE